jgi:cell wall assembly regulator SMI1
MRDVWDRIEAWLSANAPNVLEGLNSGASEAALQEAEAYLGVAFPADVRESYGIHNGQPRDAPGLTDGGEFLSLERMREEWQLWKDPLDGGDFDGITSEPQEPIRNDWWHPKWIPLTYDGAGNHLCLDLDPAPGGNLGQIITMWHDDGERTVEAPSFRAWLEELVANLESGDYIYSEEYFGIVSREDVE